jgi:hypothetical protein
MLLQYALRLYWLYCLVAGSSEHRGWAPFSGSGRQIERFDAFRLKTGPALITEELQRPAAFSGV